MGQIKSPFLNVLQERGYIHQATDLEGLDQRLCTSMVSAYMGFDATSNSLHIGNLVGIMMLRHLQHFGHRPVVLLGGGTTKIGDPSGKDESRKLLSATDIQHNTQQISKIFYQFLKVGNQTNQAAIVNNAEWLDPLKYIDFLRDFGRHFSINRMLSFDSVRLRLEREQTLSFLEFNYMLLQAYDFLHLSRHQNCLLQLGGSDQWGNIISGIELARRVDNRELFGLCNPLITNSSGAKMGKTVSGAIWLDKTKLTAYDYWQYWRNCSDQDVGRFLKLFTELPMDEIKRLEALQGSELNEAKIILADATTSLAHGKDEAEKAALSAKKTFEQGGLGEELPALVISSKELQQGIALYDLLRRAGMAASNSEARRLIKAGGARLNDQPITDDLHMVNWQDYQHQQVIKISAGRKRHTVVKLDCVPK